MLVADELLARKAQEVDANVDENVRVNTYLQTWDTKVSELSPDLAGMVKAASKNSLRMEGLAIARNIQREMPIWFHQHSTAKRTLFTGGQHHKDLVRCLKLVHEVRTTGDAEDLARRLPTPRHRNGKNCRCADQ